jgi:predicted nuclease of predicted toxin-antitoxin system
MSRSSDLEILLYAKEQDRIVVTADLDFPRLLALLGLQRPGVVLFRGGNFSVEQATTLPRAALAVLQPKDFLDCVVVLDGERIRRRPLPLKDLG